MSNDRHEDERVSAAYKELASEQTPAHLDKKVLAMAAGAAKKPAYSRWLAWSRPAAWAATITLCLAITLELAQGPAMDVATEAYSPAVEPATDEYKADDDASVEQDLANRQGVASQQFNFKDQELAESIAKSAASEKTSLARSASKQSFNVPAPVAAEPKAEARDTAVALEAAPAGEAAIAPARAEENLVMSRAAVADDFSADGSVCPAEVRAIADDWLDCILELEADGRDDAAASERELLIDTFPDFKLP